MYKRRDEEEEERHEEVREEEEIDYENFYACIFLRTL